MKKNILLILINLTVFLFAVAQNALALSVTYEALPEANSSYSSFHSDHGPVLADDFVPAVGGKVESVEWWGSGFAFGEFPCLWELTFHGNDFDDANNEWEPSSPYVSQFFVWAQGADTDGDGIYHYMAQWNSQEVVLTAGTSYWFSVANGTTELWTWALSFAPNVGSELYGAMLSTGDAGLPPSSFINGPHDGPWTPLVGSPDFAFKINVGSEVNAIPEPATMLLFGTGFSVLAVLRRRKKGSFMM